MRAIVLSFPLLIASSALCGCRGEPRAESPGPPTEIMAATATGPHLCPMSVPGSSARVLDVPDGVALELVTKGSAKDVAELRRRARGMAQQGGLGMMAGPGGGMGAAGRGRNIQEAARTSSEAVRVEDIPRGIRVVQIPSDPSRLDLLRARAHAHATHMANNTACARAQSSAPQ